jgi:hypothetical protein
MARLKSWLKHAAQRLFEASVRECTACGTWVEKANTCEYCGVTACEKCGAGGVCPYCGEAT